MVRVLRSPADALSCALFPSPCRVCGLPLLRFSRTPVCGSCWILPSQPGSLCSTCGDSLAAEGECRVCRLAGAPFEIAVAHGRYESNLRALLHLLKYDRMQAVAAPLGRLLALRISAIPNLPEELVLVPVPLFRSRQRQRGFNQSELLARATLCALRRLRPGLRLRVASGLLERRRATESQSGLSSTARRRNVRGAFFVRKAGAVRGANVLLIDDIFTTGSTARACSQALRQAGAARVLVATVARAQRRFAPPALPAAAAAEGSAGLPSREIPMEQDVALWDAPARAPA